MLQKSKFAQSNRTYSAGNWQCWAIAQLQQRVSGDIRKCSEYRLVAKFEIEIGQGKITRNQAESQFLQAIG